MYECGVLSHKKKKKKKKVPNCWYKGDHYKMLIKNIQSLNRHHRSLLQQEPSRFIRHVYDRENEHLRV